MKYAHIHVRAGTSGSSSAGGGSSANNNNATNSSNSSTGSKNDNTHKPGLLAVGKLMPSRDPVKPLQPGDFFVHRKYGKHMCARFEWGRVCVRVIVCV